MWHFDSLGIIDGNNLYRGTIKECVVLMSEIGIRVEFILSVLFNIVEHFLYGVELCHIVSVWVETEIV